MCTLILDSIIKNETPIFNQHKFIGTTTFGLLIIIIFTNELWGASQIIIF
jgi:hypothetical protein